jgi:hypothetical protein
MSHQEHYILKNISQIFKAIWINMHSKFSKLNGSVAQSGSKLWKGGIFDISNNGLTL